MEITGNMKEIAIVEARRDKWPALKKIWSESVFATHYFLRAEDYAALAEAMESVYFPSMEEIWLCRKEGMDAGFIACNGACVEMLFVSPKFFAQGIGSALLNHASKRKGALNLAVNTENRAALGFYSRKGFVIEGFSTHDGQGREYPLFHMAANKAVTQ